MSTYRPTQRARTPDVDGLVATLRQVAPRVAYLIPDFHNPTGALMTDEQRAQVAADAEALADDRDRR